MEGLQAFWIRLTADKKRFGMLCACVGLGLLLWARLILISDMPQTAIADPDAGPLTEGSAPAVLPEERAPAAPIVLLDQPDRDPFVVSDRFFPRPDDSQGLTGDGSKSGGRNDDERTAPDLRAVLTEATRDMRLEVTIPAVGTAVIDGRKFQLHDVVVVAPGEHDVVLAEVRQRQVVLRLAEHTLSLDMNEPGRGR